MSKMKTDADGVVVIEPYNPVPRSARSVPTECGKPYIIRADLYFDDDGEKLARPGEKLDLDAMIQAAAASTDIAAIVARAKMGDESVLHVSEGFVGDSTVIPKDLYDYKRMNDLYDKVSASFDTLPDGLKELFGGQAEDYLNSIIAGKAEEIVRKYHESQNKPVNPTDGENK